MKLPQLKPNLITMQVIFSMCPSWQTQALWGELRPPTLNASEMPGSEHSTSVAPLVLNTSDAFWLPYPAVLSLKGISTALGTVLSTYALGHGVCSQLSK